MNESLTACWSRGATWAIAVLSMVIGPAAARADYLVKTFAEGAPISFSRDPRGSAGAGHAPLRVAAKREDHFSPDPKPAMDEASLAAALQALFVCAIPPPTNTLIQKTTTNDTTTTTSQPGAPAAPPFTQENTITQGIDEGGGVTIEDVPEPASLLLALVGAGMAGVAIWNRRRNGQLAMA